MIRAKQLPTIECSRKFLTSVGGFKFRLVSSHLPAVQNQRLMGSVNCLHVNSHHSRYSFVKKLCRKSCFTPILFQSYYTKMHQRNVLQADETENQRTTFADIKPICADTNMAALLQSVLQSNTSRQSCKTVNAFPFEICDRNSCLIGYSYLKPIDSTISYQDPYLILRRNYATKQNEGNDESFSNSTKTKDPLDQANQKDLPPRNNVGEAKETKTAQLKKLFAVYGSFAVGFHIVISLTSLGLMYLAVSSGIDLIGLMSKMGIEMSNVASGASTFVVAYAVHKLILPVRASITLISVPVAVRYLRKLGYFKK